MSLVFNKNESNYKTLTAIFHHAFTFYSTFAQTFYAQVCFSTK